VRAVLAGVRGEFGPVVLERAAAAGEVFKVGLAEIFVLLDVEPEVEGVFGGFALEENLAG
jgi:hypothetical protein